MVNLVANKQWGKALIVTDGQLVKLACWIACLAHWMNIKMSYHPFDEVFPKPDRRAAQKGFYGVSERTILSPAAAVDRYRKSGENS